MLPGTQPNFGPVKANILSLYAGINYALGWNNSSGKEASGITPLAGIDYAHWFSKKVAVSAGVGYAELSNLNKTYSSTTTRYDFGANATVSTLTPKSLYYLSIPVKFQYNFSNKFSSRFGLDYMWLMNTSSTLTTYQQNYFGQETGNTSQTKLGYTQGFSNYDVQFALSGTYMITDRFGLSLEYYYGMVYVENNSFPGINQYERNSGFRFFISYQFMK